MKTRTKALLLSLCVVVLTVATAFGTYAYLTDKDAATNTFTVGSVHIDLDEAKVNKDGTYVTNKDNRTDKNTYHLIPGHSYIKDPTVTVKGGSSESYVRMLVTVNYSSQLDAIFGEDGVVLSTIFNNYDSANWELTGNREDSSNNTRTYEFRYIGTENQGTKAGTVAATETDLKLDALFDSFTIPGSITKEQLATLVTRDQNGKITSQFTINVEAHAIQAAGFDTADDAWAAFESQTNKS